MKQKKVSGACALQARLAAPRLERIADETGDLAIKEVADLLLGISVHHTNDGNPWVESQAAGHGRLVCVVGGDYGVVLWAYGDAAAAMDEAYGVDLLDWPLADGDMPPCDMRDRVVVWDGLLDHDEDGKPYMEGKWREATWDELLSLYRSTPGNAHSPEAS